MVTDGVPGPTDVNHETILRRDGVDDDEIMLGIYAISRAHFTPKVKRYLYIGIPKEDLSDQDGDVVGKLIVICMGLGMPHTVGLKIGRNYRALKATQPASPNHHYSTTHNEAHVEPLMGTICMYLDDNRTLTI